KKQPITSFKKSDIASLVDAHAVGTKFFGKKFYFKNHTGTILAYGTLIGAVTKSTIINDKNKIEVLLLNGSIERHALSLEQINKDSVIKGDKVIFNEQLFYIVSLGGKPLSRKKTTLIQGWLHKKRKG
ncbi:MAG: hypothetical protein LRY46_00380, partial [Candidatus Pacebacteria bacterium]|nr:hypothetical protein [Candidatus Paceibacterota bacterium]